MQSHAATLSPKCQTTFYYSWVYALIWWCLSRRRLLNQVCLVACVQHSRLWLLQSLVGELGVTASWYVTGTQTSCEGQGSPVRAESSSDSNTGLKGDMSIGWQLWIQLESVGERFSNAIHNFVIWKYAMNIKLENHRPRMRQGERDQKQWEKLSIQCIRDRDEGREKAWP